MTEHYTDQGHLLIRNSDIKDGFFEFGENPIYLDEEFSEQNKSRMHQLGDVITVHTGDIGTSAVIGDNEVNSIGFATIVTRPNQEVLDSDYFATYLNTDTHKQWAISMATGDGRSNYNLKDYTKLVVPIPQIKEQKKIAACIGNLNNLITLHQRKYFIIYNKLITWEQRKLGDFGKATGGTSIESEFSEDGIYKVISIGSYSENSVYNDQGIRAIKSDKTSNRVLNRNDLTMILNDKTTSGNIIGRVLLIEESGIYVYNQRTERIEINLDEYDSVFLYEMLNAPNIREKIIKQAQGNTQIYVNWTAISLLKYMIPSKEEQVKIGEYLHSISNLITLHRRAL